MKLPLHVEGIKLGVSTADLVAIVREGESGDNPQSAHISKTARRGAPGV